MPDTGMDSQAYVTLVTSDDYAVGAIVLAHSLRATGTHRRIAVMVSPALSSEARIELGEVFDVLHEVELLNSHDVERLHLLRRPELGVTFTKICLWTLTQYEKVVYLDADTLVLKNVDDLFESPELSGAPDVGWPDCFNSGVFVASPSEATYDALLRRSYLDGSFDGGDQGLLNQHFTNWNRLSFLYNVVPGSFYSYSPAFRHYFNQIKIVHFIGPLKPWKAGRNAPDAAAGEGRDLQAYWWTVHDAYRSGKQSDLHLRGPTATASHVQAASSRAHGGLSVPALLQPSPWQRAHSPSSNEELQSLPIDFMQFPLSAYEESELFKMVDATKSPAEKNALLESIKTELRHINAALKAESSDEARHANTLDTIQERVARLTHVLMKHKYY